MSTNHYLKYIKYYKKNQQLEGGGKRKRKIMARELEFDLIKPREDVKFSISSPDIVDGQPIDPRYSFGETDTPRITWQGVPDETKELVLLCYDPDAAETWIHWLITGIDPRGELSSGTVGTNSFGNQQYDGPHPPQGSGLHHYRFRLYALNDDSGINASVKYQYNELMDIMQGKIIEWTEFTGTYENS
jgi:Raf kinase inhibitor-like YbhB/YbcL family protein